MLNVKCMNKPPPYFPQGQLSPPDPNRYKKFKRTVALVIIGFLLILVSAGIGIFYLIKMAAN
ncbi:MAG: hypothetical protein ACR2LT_04330 [Pyrinomonadaceae bacterium]